MTRAADEMLLCRLHLHAVLPALEAVASLVPRAQQLMANANFALGLRVADGPAAMVIAGDGKLRVDPSLAPTGGVVLHFFRPAHLNAIFQQRSAFPPIPVRGWTHLPRLRPFLQLTRELEDTLEPDEKALADEELLRRHLQVSFQVALRAVPIVARHDARARRALAHTPFGILAIRVPTISFEAWIRWENGELSSGLGKPDRDSDVIVTIRDEETAALLLAGRIDPQVAVGTGRVCVDGLIPLADGLDVLLQRVDAYLGPAARARA